MSSRNLIRFDWAINRLLRNKADYLVLEGFLSELLKDTIKIDSILESEGNKQYANDKLNRVDMLVRNSKKELVIIEVQNEQEYDYFHRMAYGSAKALTEYISVGSPYKDIKKIYSINIVYFDLGQGVDYIYHGKTDFTGIHHKDKLLLSAKQTELLEKNEPSEIFPEYYVIKVNQFNDIAKDTLDEWIYYLKHNEIKDDFTAKGINKAKELWRLDKLNKEELAIYQKHLEDLRYSASMTWTLKVEEEDKVRKDEAIKNKKEIAKSMKLKGLEIALIKELTGLEEDEINSL
jgi:predicted transposase/invertase (TIGR01784 family)